MKFIIWSIVMLQYRIIFDENVTGDIIIFYLEQIHITMHPQIQFGNSAFKYKWSYLLQDFTLPLPSLFLRYFYVSSIRDSFPLYYRVYNSGEKIARHPFRGFSPTFFFFVGAFRPLREKKRFARSDATEIEGEKDTPSNVHNSDLFKSLLA